MSESQYYGLLAGMYTAIVASKEKAFHKNYTVFDQQIKQLIYAGCNPKTTVCKRERNPATFLPFVEIKKVLLSFPQDDLKIPKEHLDDEKIITMLVQFLQAIFYPIGHMSVELQSPNQDSSFVNDFVSVVNKLTRKDYMVSHCIANDSCNAGNSDLCIRKTYGCGRAISAIDYDMVPGVSLPENPPRIIIHSTVSTENSSAQIQDISDYITKYFVSKEGGKPKRTPSARKKKVLTKAPSKSSKKASPKLVKTR
jgi:hypothetical protein